MPSGSDGRTMPSREGFETWFDYELLLFGIAILAATLYVARGSFSESSGTPRSTRSNSSVRSSARVSW